MSSGPCTILQTGSSFILECHACITFSGSPLKPLMTAKQNSNIGETRMLNFRLIVALSALFSEVLLYIFNLRRQTRLITERIFGTNPLLTVQEGNRPIVFYVICYASL